MSAGTVSAMTKLLVGSRQSDSIHTKRGINTHKNHSSAVACDIPISRTYSGNASAEYCMRHNRKSALKCW